MSVIRQSPDVAIGDVAVPAGVARPGAPATQTFRSTSTWFYSGCVWAFCGLCAVLAIAQEPVAMATRVLMTLATVSFLTWMLLLRPHLRVTPSEVVVANVSRTHVIPFGSIRYVRTRGLVEIVASPDGAADSERTYRSWNAPGNHARAPRRSEVHARAYPGRAVSQSERRVPAGLPSTVNLAAQQLIEERMDSSGADTGPISAASRWNRHQLFAAALALVVTVLAWCV